MYFAFCIHAHLSTTISLSLKPKVQSQNAILKDTPVSLSIYHIPRFILDPKDDIFIGSTTDESKQLSWWSIFGRIRTSRITFHPKGRSLGGIGKVGVEDVESVALDHLGRGIVAVIVGLVVLVPVIVHPNEIVETRFPWIPPGSPWIGGGSGGVFGFCVEGNPVSVDLSDFGGLEGYGCG